MLDTHISLAHGNGGRFMRELIEELFARHLANPALDVQADAVRLPLRSPGEIFLTTDVTARKLQGLDGKAIGGQKDLAGGAEGQTYRIGLHVQGGIRQMPGEELLDELPHEAPAITMGKRDVGVEHE